MCTKDLNNINLGIMVMVASHKMIGTDKKTMKMNNRFLEALISQVNVQHTGKEMFIS